jgi:glycosyltransferase involved in cell wall biosynthesis
VFPSLYEGMPTVILEAMACGLPVIATDIGAVTTMVGADNGWVVPPGSALALQQALAQFLATSTAQRRLMGVASRRRVEAGFTWRRVAEETLRAIDGLVHGSLGVAVESAGKQ